MENCQSKQKKKIKEWKIFLCIFHDAGAEGKKKANHYSKREQKA